MTNSHFHPAVDEWFGRRFGAPTEPQRLGWPAIAEGRDTLIAAPTGSGKTLAAFLAAIDDLTREALEGTLGDETRVVYVSPLKALSNDIERNLREPLRGIGEVLAARGETVPELRVQVRTGDTPASARTAMLRRPPHIFVTTPESLYILLTSEGGRRMLRTARTVIVDEIHALVGSKRGSHLALSLERLEDLAGVPLTRVGLSATVRPIREVARFLVGAGRLDPKGEPRCHVVDAGHERTRDLAIEVPQSPLEPVMPLEVWEEIYDRLGALCQDHRTTLIFVNTRRLAERVTRHLAERIGADAVTAHHGSLSREQRHAAEQRLKAGELRAIVATASLELGIDIGSVELVCQLGSTRTIATWLQRVGRSGHSLGAIPKGRLFPLSRDELVEAVALQMAVSAGDLDAVSIPEAPLDILAQQIVASVAAEPYDEESLYSMVRRALPYRNLPRDAFDAVVRMLSEGFSTRRGRRAALIHRDAVNRRVRPRRGSRLTAITSGGAIPDNADYDVILEPGETFVGTLNEDFAIESMAGDIFQLGNASWQILRVEPGKVRVADAQGKPPTIPFWLGEAPSRSTELSIAVSRLREEVVERHERGQALEWLTDEHGIVRAAAEQLVDYLAAAHTALGAMPTRDTLVLERFFDESGGMQLVLHAPFGSRINRGIGLALRKRFCQRFNFELQAAATEDAIVLSLGQTHSFPLDEVFSYLSPNSVREILVQALLVAPMFATRWRWNATRSLAVPRSRGGKRVPPRLQRMQADDLTAVVFPDQLACAENLAGKREIPDHPLVNQTIRDCLEEAMDIDGVETLLRSIRAGEKRLLARDVSEPSPLSQEILSARPYAFLDDAPLEERRTAAVYSRRWLDPERAADIGALDGEALARVRAEAWPEAHSGDELHDALVLLGFLTAREGATFSPSLLDELVEESRAGILEVEEGTKLWVAAERVTQLRAAFPEARWHLPVSPPDDGTTAELNAEDALRELVRGRLEGLGPTTAEEVARSCGAPRWRIEAALAALESEGFVLRGRFDSGVDGEQWCERRLLARIHRYTLSRLRQEIRPVSSADFYGFLVQWQRAAEEVHVGGPEGLAAVLAQLEGLEAPAAAWEAEILPARVKKYDPAWLDMLCLSGRFVWARRSQPTSALPRGPIRTTPIALLRRDRIVTWGALRAESVARTRSPAAEVLLARLREAGASFFADLTSGCGLPPEEVRAGLAELAASGLVTSDSFSGLRALIDPARRRSARRTSGIARMDAAGRWSLLPGEGGDIDEAQTAERIARTLLGRYGVVMRRIREREGQLPPWRNLLIAMRRMEARGEIRGGRFVSGYPGEQYALPEAVGLLRAARREAPSAEMVAVGAADPLNLLGILTPGPRLSPTARARILLRNGTPVAVREAGVLRSLVTLSDTEAVEVQEALARKRVARPERPLRVPSRRWGTEAPRPG